MKQTRLMMGMPITVEIVDASASREALATVFSFFQYVDDTFSTYKKTSEISRINSGEIPANLYSGDIKEIFALAEKTQRETGGYYDMKKDDKLDPTGVVKGWAIQKASTILKEWGYQNFYIDAGGDIQVAGKNQSGLRWIIGIRNPFNREEVVKRVSLSNEGIATSGTYIRGNHIYDPHTLQNEFSIVSLTVIGPDVFEADRFATAAFAMGDKGIGFIERKKGLEGYMIDKNGIATYTSGFDQYVIE